MESYGAILKKTREEKNLDYEAVYKETSISKEFLKGLEDEETQVFPGEPYLIGFLKNYADFLGLDSARLVTLYHAKKLQESPPPAALTKRERPAFLVPLLVAIGIVVLAGLVALSVVIAGKLKSKHDENVEVIQGNTFKKYELTDKIFNGRVFKGDQLILGSDKGNIILTVAETQGIFALETPSGVQYVELSEEVEMDIDGDSRPELIVYVSDVSQKNVERGAEVRIMLKDMSSAAVAAPEAAQIPSAEDLPKSKKMTEIFSDTRAYPFTLNAVFRSGCLMRYRPDRKETVEDYYANGDVVNITASNGIKLWLSNGNSVKIQIIANGKSYDLGVLKAGAVAAQDIKWVKDIDGKYKVVIVEMD